MRNNEALTLQINCIKEIIDKETGHITKIIGETTKFSGTKKEVRWITTKEIVPVIEILSKISTIIASRNNFVDNNIRLFISPLHLTYKNKYAYKKQKISDLANNKELSLDYNKLIITKEDQNDLKFVDYFRNWENENRYKIGQAWHFRSHQYRRSLAFYAIKSGLVSLGALQIQFKHLFREMTLYYGNGAARAKELLSIKHDHIANIMDECKHEIEAMLYIKNIIFNEDELLDTHIENLNQDFKTLTKDKYNYILLNKDKTIQNVKSGIISYKETALGGCCSVKPCNKNLTRSFIACIECDEGIIKQKKYDNVIFEQEEFIKHLPKDSIEYKTELIDLEELKNKRKIIFRS